MHDNYDIIVVGGGHAGAEAAAAAARLGSKVLLVTMQRHQIAQMSCNPAMGGIAKGQIVREIDALGGFSGIITDKSMIQFRMLNKSKGPAMWSPRAQCDKHLFSHEWVHQLEQVPLLDFWEDLVVDLIVEKEKVVGVVTSIGLKIYAKAVVLTNGTFLNGKIFIGEKVLSGGRIGEKPSLGLTEVLCNYGFLSERMKTGTPVRIDGRTIDYSQLEEQKGDADPKRFSFTDTPILKEQRSCHLAYTCPLVHEILAEGFDKSPMFTGRIQGIGPRYCPSIEDKIDRFSDKTKHQLFVEPEGWDTVEVYLNGFSSSLPLEVQFKALRHIKGFEQAKIFRPGYAIEYDFFPPHQLYHSLETKLVENLFFAGQINGTTGYEEAGAQGLMAGINAHRKINEESPVILERSQAYIGVLIDDLITKEINEPYRMFTSRAEFRILLRQDNADARLTPLGREIGLIDDERWADFQQKQEKIADVKRFLEKTSVEPKAINDFLEESKTSKISQKQKLANVILRPQVNLVDFWKVIPEELKLNFKQELDEDVLEEVEVLIKYAGYISKERELADKAKRFENMKIAPGFDFMSIEALSYEAREKLTKHKPATIGQASKISGVSPADIALLIVHISR